jgi:ankyrin repeat protein
VTDDSETESEEDSDDEDLGPQESVLLPLIKKLIDNYSLSRENMLKLLFDAVNANTVDIAEHLCTLLGGLSGADIDSSELLLHAVKSPSEYMLDVLLRFEPHVFTNVLHGVLEQNKDSQERVIKKLLDAGARPHVNDLIYAIGWLKAKVVDLFLRPEYSLHVSYSNSNGDTLLHFLGNRSKAASSRSSFIAAKRICHRLQTAGCKINAENSSGQTPLSVAQNTIIRRVLIEAGGGGTISVKSFRKLDLEHLHYDIILNTPETMMMFTDDTANAVRCLPCKHVFSADFLQGWVKQNEADLTYDSGGQTYTLGLPSRLKEECPTCKRKIEHVEFFSKISAAKWNRLEDAANAVAERAQEDIKNLETTPQFMQFMADAAIAENEEKVLKRKVEELDAMIKKAKEDAKKANARKNQAKNKADDAIDSERARIRAAANAAEKAIRDKQILDGLKQLRF